MYRIYINNNIVHLNTDIDKVVRELNKILSKYHDYKIPLTIEKTDRCIIVRTNDTVIILDSDEDIILTVNDIHLLPYFLLNFNRVGDVITYKLDGIINLDPHYILDLITFKDCMIDPYYLLVKLFNINEELIYQTFILYLNKTIKITSQPNKIDINEIIDDFLYTRNNLDDINKYYKLFSFYVSNKKLLPFMITYSPYISQLLI